MRRMLKVMLLTTVLMSGCSVLSSMLPSLGGGTNVAANTQIGKENNQTGVMLGEVKDNKVEANDIGKLTQADQSIEAHGDTTIQNIPPWVILLLILGWLLPSPKEIWDGLWAIPSKVKGKNK